MNSLCPRTLVAIVIMLWGCSVMAAASASLPTVTSTQYVTVATTTETVSLLAFGGVHHRRYLATIDDGKGKITTTTADRILASHMVPLATNSAMSCPTVTIALFGGAKSPLEQQEGEMVKVNVFSPAPASPVKEQQKQQAHGQPVVDNKTSQISSPQKGQTEQQAVDDKEKPTQDLKDSQKPLQDIPHAVNDYQKTYKDTQQAVTDNQRPLQDAQPQDLHDKQQPIHHALHDKQQLPQGTPQETVENQRPFQDTHQALNDNQQSSPDIPTHNVHDDQKTAQDTPKPNIGKRTTTMKSRTRKSEKTCHKEENTKEAAEWWRNGPWTSRDARARRRALLRRTP